MARVASMEFILAADHKKFKRDLRSAKFSLRAFTRDAKRRLGGMTKALAGLSTAGGTALVGLAAKSLKASDDMRKAARNAGLAFTDYQQLKHGFDLVGLGGENVVKTMASLSRTVSYAKDGIMTYTRELAKAGLTADDFGESLSENFFIALEGVRNIENATTRLAVAQTLFGRAGKQMGSITAEQAGALSEYGARLIRVGGIIRQDLAEGAEGANDALTVLTTTINAQFANAFLEAFKGVGPATMERTIKSVGKAVFNATSVLIKFGQVVWTNRDLIKDIIKYWVAWKAALAVKDAAAVVIGGFKQILKWGNLLLGFLTKARLGALLMWGAMAIGAAVGGLVVSGVVGAWKEVSAATDHLVDLMKAAWTSIKLGFERAWLAIKSAFYLALDSMLTPLEGFVNRAVDVLNRLPGMNLSKVNIGGALDSQLAQLLVDMGQVDAASKAAAKTLAEGWDNFVVAGTEAGEKIKEVMHRNAELIKQWLKDAFDLDLEALGIKLPGLGDAGEGGDTEPLKEPKGEQKKLWFGGKVGKAFDGLHESTQREIVGMVNGWGQTLTNAIVSGDWKGVGKAFVTEIQQVLVGSLIKKGLRALGGALGIQGLGEYARGGVVPGATGAPQLAIVHGQEEVLTPQERRMRGGGDGLTQIFHLNVSGDATRQQKRALVKNATFIADTQRQTAREQGFVS